MKALAVLLYGISFSMIRRVLGVSDVAVLTWVRAEAAALQSPEVPVTAVKVEIDEIWHFIKKCLASSGSGVPTDVDQWRTVAWVLGRRDDATCRRLLDKVGVSGRTFVTDD